MVLTLVHEHYQFIKEGFLPEPKVGHPVGILCPECSTPLRYFAAREDAWTIYCPQRPRNEHNWRTFRCDQFNHKRALINAGAPRPIVSSESDWGPRISPSGVHLGPKPAPTTSKSNGSVSRGKRNGSTNCLAALLNPIGSKGHPFLGQNPPIPPIEHPQVESQAGPVRAKVQYPCQRPSRGPVARNHRTTGNKGCPYQYCQSCCLEYGLGACSKHTRASGSHSATAPKETLPTRHPPSFPAGSTSSAASTSAQPTPAIGRARSGGRIHQWAQSPNTMGRELSTTMVANMQNDRRERYEAVERQIANKYDEAKVVTILLWLDDLRGIEPFCSGMTRSTHGYPKYVKVVVVRSALVDPRTPGLPQSKGRPRSTAVVKNPLEETSTSKAPSTSTSKAPSTSNSSLRASSPPFLRATSQPPRASSPPSSDDDEVVVVKLYLTHSADAKRSSSPDEIEVVKNTIVTSSVKVKSEPSEELPDFDPFNETPREDHISGDVTGTTPASTSTASPVLTNPGQVLKRKWPGRPSKVLVSTLLAWYKECMEGGLGQRVGIRAVHCV
ncbi:uncharacterized protein MELLADRAFT_110147 [Melampsora larici-populina 98AG31]|uniref:Uncharacterized protein n=1 Tax=Melampsora larici-populina (strain 98AG31 / pathotype 3-4-7) TaxID=747676 RepID=F4RYU4_MELLP|nr:uncharacterized protein MELLADRAFT_110147 [Melampsora larici-populina 98AG31]EGG02309.1 hypothetical protein MELLADRAFT_110147 [Melampsora larici-populina 98AG31]